jgi:hypothetical protein
MGAVLLSPRPADKRLDNSLAGASPAQELGEGIGGEPIHRTRSEQGEHSQVLELRSSRQRFGDVAAIERTAEA